MFNIGDKIFYPMHGAGEIKNIENKEIMGELYSYYVIKLPGEVTVMVPTQNAEKLGLRLVISEEEANNVINVILDNSTEMSEKWVERYNDNKERLKTGDIFEVADIYRNLNFRNKKKNLSTSEKKMLLNAKQVLFSELSYSTNTPFEELDTMIENKLNESFELLEENEKGLA